MGDVEVLGIIPARGGSKSIPRKNVALLNGRPLISYTIQAARESQFISRLIVSTDDEEIARISAAFGAEVPFMRPKELGQDSTPSIEVVLHALEVLRSEYGYCPDIVVLLQATCPLRNARDIDQAISTYLSTEADVVVSVAKVEEHPFNMYKVEGGFLCAFTERDTRITLRQDYPEVYRLNGAVYVSRPETLRRLHSFISGRLVPYVMPKERSVDIDDPLDMLYASILLDGRGALGN